MNGIYLFAILTALLSTVAGATGLYKYVDENGNVRYTDRPPQTAAEDQIVETVDVNDGYMVKTVSSLTPLPPPIPTPRLVLRHMDMRLAVSETRAVTIGRLFFGPGCRSMVELVWNEGFLEYDARAVSQYMAEPLNRYGYGFAGVGTGVGSYSLSGTISKIRIDACARTRNELRAGNMAGSVYLKVAWRARNGSSEQIAEVTSEGAFHGMQAGVPVDKAFERAITQATQNLLAEPEFRHAIAVETRDVVVVPDTTVEVSKIPLSFGDAEGLFVEKSASLLNASVTIRTRHGHGSGVVISDGIIMTNQHVVGDDDYVTVVTERGEFDGEVVSVQAMRDVALVRTSFSATPVKISRRNLTPGEGLYVIGTPLDESLSHTVTRGILSATRQMDGQQFYQTDASINRGNSGGPVFDETGDLIGISVAGLFTRDGAGMNVNYVIPIHSALKAVGLRR